MASIERAAARQAAATQRFQGAQGPVLAQAAAWGGPSADPTVTDQQEKAAQLVAKVQAAKAAGDPTAMAKHSSEISKLDQSITDPAVRKEYGLKAPKKQGILGQIGSAVSSVPGAKTVLNVLDRPTQAAQHLLLDARQDEGTADTLHHLWGSLAGDYSVGGKKQDDRANLAQIVHNDPDYKAHGKGDAALNFLGDVALDPTTYLTFGASGAAKSGLRTLAKEGASDAAKQIATVGLKRALKSGTMQITEDEIPEILRRAAMKGGAHDVEKTVARQMKGIAGSAAGGARLRIPGLGEGFMIPGSEWLSPTRLGPKTSILDNTVLGGVRDSVQDVFKPRAGIEREYGKDVANELGQMTHNSRSLTDKAVTEGENALRGSLKGVTADELANLPGKASERMAGVSDAIKQAQTLNEKYGLGYDIEKTLQAHGNNFASGAAQTVEEVGRKAGMAKLAQDIVDPSAGLLDAAGERIGKTLEDFGGDATKAQQAGYREIGEGASKAWVPEAMAEEIKKFSSKVTNDQGVQTIQRLQRNAMRQWKTMATVAPISPAFFARNFYSNPILMVGAGFRHAEVWPSAIRVERAIAKGTVESLPEDLQRIASEVTEHNVVEGGQALRELGAGSQDVNKLVQAGDKTHAAGDVYRGAVQKGGDLNKAIESQARIAMYMDGIKQGAVPSEAAMRTEKALFNYADITKAEEGIKNAAPFYTFMRKNLAAQADALVHHPGFLTGQVHGADAFSQAFGDPDTGALPSWAVMGGYLPAGGSSYKFDTPLLSAADNVAGLSELANILPGGDAVDYGELSKTFTGPTGGPVVGALKAAIEDQTGKNSFTGGNAGQGTLNNPWVSNLLPAAGRADKAVENAQGLIHGNGNSALSLLGVSNIDNASSESGALSERTQDTADSIASDSKLPLLSALRDVGLVPPKQPDLEGKTPAQQTAAKRSYLIAMRKYKQAQAGHLTPDQQSLLAAIRAGQ